MNSRAALASAPTPRRRSACADLRLGRPALMERRVHDDRVVSGSRPVRRAGRARRSRSRCAPTPARLRLAASSEFEVGFVEIDRRHAGQRVSERGRQIAPAGAEIGGRARQIRRQRFGQQPRAGVDAVMREHAGRGLETASTSGMAVCRRSAAAIVARSGVGRRETRRPRRDISATGRPARPAFPSRLRRLAMPSSLAAGDHDQPASADPFDRLGDPRSRSARDGGRRAPARRRSRRPRRVASTRWPRAAAPGNRGRNPAPATASRRTLGQAEARLGAEEQHARTRRRQRRASPALERMEQGLQGVAAHWIAIWLKRKRARASTAAPVPNVQPIRPIRRRFLRSLPSCRGRVPCRWSGRRPSSTGGPCRARRSPSA